MKNISEQAFQIALDQATIAVGKMEIPIGAVIVKKGEIVSYAHNETERRGNFTAHAEMIAIEKACHKLKTKYLEDCDLYITLEPCKMCKAAAQLSRIHKIYYLAKSPRFGGRFKTLRLTRSLQKKSLHKEASIDILRRFFKTRRTKISS